jgi:TPR repeat protein
MNLLLNLTKDLGLVTHDLAGRERTKAPCRAGERSRSARLPSMGGTRPISMHILAASAATMLLVSPAAAQSDRANQAQARLAMMAPAREQIPNAYLSALQRTPVVAAPVAARAVPPEAELRSAVRRIDTDELTLLMKRAISLLASGDIPPARLLLERAADAQEASAAFLLAQTYDPDVLGTSDIRTIAPDPAEARLWYRKAAELGYADARRRLPQIQK